MGFRYVTAIEPKAAQGLVADVYRQQAADVGLTRMPALMVLSPVPGLLAATWAMLRESLLAGTVSRTEREIVALGVSMANRCSFCVGAHTLFLHATGDHRLAETVSAGGRPGDPRQAALFDWAKDAGSAPEVTPELVGTALTFHFINRMVSALHTEDVLPGGMQRSRAVRSLAGRTLARPARRLLPPGESLRLLPGTPEGPAWAGGSPVGTAYAALSEVAGRGASLLPVPELVREQVEWWAGDHPPLGRGWLADALAGLPASAVPVTRLALLGALAPYQITDADVAAWPHTDADLVRLLAFSAITAVRRAESAITTASGTPL